MNYFLFFNLCTRNNILNQQEDLENYITINCKIYIVRIFWRNSCRCVILTKLIN
jgi:hypothetical protein